MVGTLRSRYSPSAYASGGVNWLSLIELALFFNQASSIKPNILLTTIEISCVLLQKLNRNFKKTFYNKYKMIEYEN